MSTSAQAEELRLLTDMLDAMNSLVERLETARQPVPVSQEQLRRARELQARFQAALDASMRRLANGLH